MSKRKTFGLGFHRLSKSTKRRICEAKTSTSWQNDSESSSCKDDEIENYSHLLNRPVPKVTLPSDSHDNISYEQPSSSDASNCDDSQLEELDFYSSSESCHSSDTSGPFEVYHPNTSSYSPCDSEPSNSMVQFIQKWAVDYNIPLNSVDALLKGLRTHPCFVGLPRCARSILNTPSNLKKYVVDPGVYVHLGLKDQLLLLISSVSTLVDEVKLLVNVDGLPPFKSSAGELYPILVSVVNISELKGKVIPVGIYYGIEKPKSVTEFLMPFIEELIALITNGVTIDDVFIDISLAGFCCDAPAKSFIMGIIGHGGFYSCTKCMIKGVTVERKRVFLQTDCQRRTHDDFVNKVDKHFCCRDTPLFLIPNINFVDSFVLDYMHLVCLGVVRTLLFTWTTGTKSKKSRISKTNRSILSGRLVSLIPNIPCEFVRKPRDLGVLLRWKATEFRLFLLYVGPVVLKGIVDSQHLIHFLELHVAMTILLNPRFCKRQEARENARKLLIHFVKSTAVLYGDQLITHNFHGLIHIVDDADNFVNKIDNFSLNDISAFPFENYLQSLKKLIRGKNKPLEQICNRLAERFAFESRPNSEAKIKTSPSYPCFPEKSCHSNGPLLALCCAPQYTSAVFKDFKITTSLSNSCCGLSNGEIIRVYNFAYSTEEKGMVAIGKRFITKSDFYSDPLVPSSHLGIFRVEKLSSWKSWPVTSIVRKYVCLPYKNGFVAFPLLHACN